MPIITPLNDVLLVLGSPVFVPIAVSICIGLVGSLLLFFVVFHERRHHDNRSRRHDLYHAGVEVGTEQHVIPSLSIANLLPLQEPALELSE